MRRWVACILLYLPGHMLAPQVQVGPDELLPLIKANMKRRLANVPDYVCLQTVERLTRPSPDAEFKQLDTLRLQVGFVGGKEIFAWQGARQFQEKELSEMVGAGTVGTGSFAIHANNVFVSEAPEYTRRGEETVGGRRAVRYDYSVPRELSRYRLRVSPFQAFVGFHGSFWVDAETLDLIRLEVHADDIPEELQLARASEVMEYERVLIGRSECLLPKSSELTMTGARGYENRNRRTLSNCRQYVGESSLSFEQPEKTAPPRAATLELPPNLVMDFLLDTEIDPENAALGDPVQAVLARPVMHDGRLLVPEGAKLMGRLVRLEKSNLPFEHYVVGLEFDTLEFQDVLAEFSGTMEDAGPHSSLIREKKRMTPTFTRRRSTRFDILVRERQPGQGVLHWRAKSPRIPRGLKMRWRTE